MKPVLLDVISTPFERFLYSHQDAVMTFTVLLVLNFVLLAFAIVVTVIAIKKSKKRKEEKKRVMDNSFVYGGNGEPQPYEQTYPNDQQP